MRKINRFLINICSDKLSESRDFYTQLLGFQIEYDSDWFVQLVSKDKQFEIGIIEKKNQLVPKEYQTNPQGFYLTFVVDNADTIFEDAKTRNFEILENPTDTMYGQRRLLLKDPNGALVDVSSPIPNFKFESRKLKM